MILVLLESWKYVEYTVIDTICVLRDLISEPILTDLIVVMQPQTLVYLRTAFLAVARKVCIGTKNQLHGWFPEKI